MKNGLVELHTQPWAAEREWTADGIPVLHAVATLPRPEPVQGGICRRIDRFYRLQSRAYLRYCERFLFPQAREECRSALAASAPFTPTEAELTYQVTYNEGGLWSLYTQSREGGAPAVRRGDTWDLATGYPAALSAFFPAKSPWKRHLLALAAGDLERRETAGVIRLREDWRRQLRRKFNPNHFYLTAEGIVLFYPVYTLSPSSIIPTIVLPYGDSLLRPGMKKPSAV